MSLDERERRRLSPEKLIAGQQWSEQAQNLLDIERKQFERAMQLLFNGTCTAIPVRVMFHNYDALSNDLSIHQSTYTLDGFDVVQFLETPKHWALYDAEADDAALRAAYNRRPQGIDPDPKREFGLDLGQIAVPAAGRARIEIAERLHEELRMEIEHIQVRTYYRMENTFQWQTGMLEWLHAEQHNMEHLRGVSHNTREDVQTLLYGHALDPSRYYDISTQEILDEFARVEKLVKRAAARLDMSGPPRNSHSVSPVNRLR